MKKGQFVRQLLNALKSITDQKPRLLLIFAFPKWDTLFMDQNARLLLIILHLNLADTDVPLLLLWRFEGSLQKESGF